MEEKPEENVQEEQKEEQKSLYDQLHHDLENDSEAKEEVTLGKRVGLYRIKSTKLGAGNFSVVKLGVHLLTNEKVAMKIIDKTTLKEDSRKLLTSEVASMEKLYHPNIVRLYEIIDTFDKLHLMMEVAGDGCLLDRILKTRKFTEPDARTIFCQVADAVRYMHNNGVVHRDLKAENVLFSNDRVKIGDFGFSVQASATDKLDLFCGSPPYAAPELFNEDSYLGPPVDIWAIGVLLYYMIGGQQPFSADSLSELKEKILVGDFYMPQSITSAAQNLLAGMLNKNAEERLTIDAVIGCDWMQVNGQSAIVEASYGNADDFKEAVFSQLASLGVPTLDEEALSGEPRTAAVGAYRIILQSKLMEKEQAAAAKKKKGTKQRSRLCVML